MGKHRIRLIVLAIGTSFLPYLFYTNASPHDGLADGFVHIAHAGGHFQSQPYTNSLKAADLSAESGFKIFEFDILLTEDMHLVCGYRWSDFGRKTTLKEFIKARSKMNPVPCTFSELLSWLESDPSRTLIIDTKKDTEIILSILSEQTKEAHLRRQIIPQIYNSKEKETADMLGFEKTILATYRETSPEKTLEQLFVLCEGAPIGITVHYRNIAALRPNLNRAAECGSVVLVHTINSLAGREQLRSDPLIGGIFTDHLAPE